MCEMDGGESKMRRRDLEKQLTVIRCFEGRRWRTFPQHLIHHCIVRSVVARNSCREEQECTTSPFSRQVELYTTLPVRTPDLHGLPVVLRFGGC